MNSLARILRSASALWPFYLGVVLVSTVAAALGLVSPFILREATDTIVGTLRGDTTVAEVTTTLLMLAVGLLLADLANTAMTNLGGYIGDVMAMRMRQILSTRYYAKLLALPQRYFDNQVTGTVIARLDRSITSITQFLQSFSNSFFPMLIQVAAVLVITTWYYWPLTILLALLFPIYMWLTTLTSKRWQKLEGQKNEQIDLANGRFAEVIGQVKVVKSFVSEVRELDDFGSRYGRTVDITRPQSRWWHTMDTARGAALNLIFFAIYLLLFFRTLNGFFSLGDMVMLIQLVNMAKQPVFMMSWIVDAAQRAIAGSRDYFKVMEEEFEPTANTQLIAATQASGVPELDATPVQPLAPVAGEPVIDFEHVTFSYLPGEPVIRDVDFDVARGETIALVGESGGGKSTLVNLLLGLYPIDEGRLRVCGRDITELSAAELRASVGVVFQEASLFSGTIAENIAYGRPGATGDEIREVARRANAHDFIERFPKGYDTIIGERGLRLSGGQKQRVAVARAMLKDAPVLLLDEATSALDTRSERAVQAGLDELMKNRTTVIIAHRLSTIAGVDKIITLREGVVDEIGSPDQLAASGGIYAELLQLTASSSAADRARLRRYGLVIDGEDNTVEHE
ncbi:ABC transporter ATP-binding protein/permease [Corynebacterium sp. YIM 101645]|uniref:ABC transporter ATP-binding protein/permease n=1 Tax=Corynebacterium lemuris TaxID=1859292 RepID=A0ABT2FY23_9CORY|nr:ABC transporter ATP-binding protein [Corynebacterium lemuris]MCS5480150.1 ABC transporter ATP-binding protein/permease [Corynebacterium lemuris]